MIFSVIVEDFAFCLLIQGIEFSVEIQAKLCLEKQPMRSQRCEPIRFHFLNLRMIFHLFFYIRQNLSKSKLLRLKVML